MLGTQVGNGNPSSHETDKGQVRRVFKGLGQVVLQSADVPGQLKLTACADGLVSHQIEIQARAAGSDLAPDR